MHEILTGLGVLLVGVALGLVFFGGLWWTVRHGTVSSRPALWFVASLVVRVGLTVTGIYLVSGGQWQRLLACLVGFWLARVLVFWLTAGTVLGQATEKVRHAP